MLGEAYFVGILSLLDVVFGAPLDELLDRLHISDEVKYAILSKKGLLGDIFQVVQDIESFNVEGIMTFETKYGLDHKGIQKAVEECMQGDQKIA
ncbi:MAG: hypothetical protein IE887_05960 [Campylobacterales bacterium]|nr:hypothetical protein [Campylobacterales bacterium]